MKIIRQIFIDDIKGLVKNFFALVIVIGICFLPALYAWFNIYSNWDPYGNTGALKMAVYSADKGYTTADGSYVNQGDTIIDNLHENSSVDWQFVDSADDAVNGVYSGEYYAAIVIDENFTYCMYNIFSEEAEEPTLIFYQNQKKNPVATKISDTVVSTVQNNINEAFIEVVISEVFSGASDLYNNMQADGGTDGILDNLESLNEKLTTYEDTINSVIASDKVLINNLASAEEDTEYLEEKADESAASVDVANGSIASSQVTLNTYTTHLDETIDIIEASMSDMSSTLEKAKLSDSYSEMIDALERVNDDLTVIATNKAVIDSSLPSGTTVSGMTETITFMEKILSSTLSSGSDAAIKASETEIIDTINTLQKKTATLQSQLDNSLIPGVNDAIDSLEVVLSNTSTMLSSMSDTFGSTTIMFTALGATLESADTSLEKTNKALAYVNERLSEAIESAEAASDDQRMEVLVNTLSGDPELYGQFFSEPVTIETEAVYPVENYGSAVAPFYTTLAIWVGALILTAIIKVHPDKKKYTGASNIELFFGRYILYWILGQMQAIIIVVGDLNLLGIQCVEPGWFMFACSCTATTFSLFIYSLVVTWGDVGKALSVVIVVLQIAGSSGTYPIELLPEFFRKVYIFFPFPYAINAMRECTCGMYENDYMIYLLELGIFVLVSLGIGLLLKIPFEGINHYMEERMEDTEMM